MTEFQPEKINRDLQKNLEEDLARFAAKDQIQDFVAYKDSIIWRLSDEYYNSKGILAWSNTATKIIPHKIGTNYQNALAFAKLVKTNLENFPSDKQIEVLEVGAGSGRFSRHFLLALKELGINENVKLIISDYSKVNLDSISHSSILDGFTLGKDYEFELFDILKPRAALKLNPRAIFMHYVLDALPLTIVKNSSGDFKELFISSSIRQGQELNVLKNEFLQSRIEHEDEWHDYTPVLETERKYWDFFKNYHAKNYNKELYFAYSAFVALENLMSILDDKGFLLNIDILPGNEKRYITVGNSIAHEVDNPLLEAFMKASGRQALVNDDRAISRLLLSKSPDVFSSLKTCFNKVYVKENHIREYLDLEIMVEEALENKKTEGLEEKLTWLTRLAPHYAFSYELWSRYYDLINEPQKAQEALQKAKAIDFWQDLSL